MKISVFIFLILNSFIAIPSHGEIRRSADIDRQVDSLFVIASSGEIKYRGEVAPAIDSIAAIGENAVPRLVEMYDTKDARERHTINNILVEIGPDAVSYLVASLSDPNLEKIARLCYTLGNIGDSSAVEGIISVAFNPDWGIRSNAAGALGKIGSSRGNETINQLLTDTVDIVRKSAVVSAGHLMIYDAMPTIVHMLGDEFYGARMMASETLALFGLDAIDHLNDSLNSKNEMIGNLGCITLGRISGDSAAAIISTQLDSSSPLRRSLAVRAILLANSSIACGAVEILKESETDQIVLYFIDQVLNKYAER